MSGSVRRATGNDTAAMAALSKELGYPVDAEILFRRWTSLEQAQDHAVYVADHPRHGVVGWIHVFLALRLESDRFAEIGGLVVGEGARREGWGRRLVQEAEAWARRQAVKSIRVRTRVEREQAHRFYEALEYGLSKTQKIFVKQVEEPTR